MKAVALISGPFFHHLDHLAPLCHFMECPLLVDDSSTYALGKRYYPEVDIRFEMVDLLEISRLYNTIIVSTKYAKGELEAAYHAMGVTHMRFCYCPHGQSDKGLSDPTMIPEQNQDIVLFYGEKQKERLKLNGHVVGNFRLAYYKKFQSFFDALVDEEIPRGPTILYAPTWNDHETATTFFQSWRKLISSLPDSYNLVIKLHPLLEKHHPAEAYAALSFDKTKPNLRVLFEFPPIYPLLNRTDIYLGDYSSIGYDFLYFNRPLFFLAQKPVPLHNCGITVSSISEFFKQLENPQEHLTEKRSEEYAHTFSGSLFPKLLHSLL